MSWELDKEPTCRADMAPHFKRFRNTLLKPWAKGHKGRRGVVDFSHAYVNLFVEAARACPYTTGHVFAFFVAVPVVALVAGLVL